jgi:2-methylcitrate dehydratase PrpD
MAEWASALRFDGIPSEALRTARRAVLDTLAVTLLGSRSQAAAAGVTRDNRRGTPRCQEDLLTNS